MNDISDVHSIFRENSDEYIEAAGEGGCRKRILFITPDLSLNGANVVLEELLDEFYADDYAVWLIAADGGDLGADFAERKINIAVRKNVRASAQFRRCLQTDFEYVFLNTSSVHYYALYFINTDMPVYWWFHESQKQLELTQRDMVHLGLLSENFHILAVTDRVRTGLERLYGCRPQILNMPVREESFAEEENSGSDTYSDGEKIIFFIPGAYTYIKGQDIVLQAISGLPDEYSHRAEFIFAGYKLPGQEGYYQQLRQLAENLPNVRMLDQLTRRETYDQYKSCSCVLAPSRIDSTPTTIVEAMMHHRLCIVSAGAGISEYMQDCVNGFVFENENIEELRKRILFTIAEYENVKKLGENGYQIYLDRFSPKAVSGQMIEAGLLTQPE